MQKGLFRTQPVLFSFTVGLEQPPKNTMKLVQGNNLSYIYFLLVVALWCACLPNGAQQQNGLLSSCVQIYLLDQRYSVIIHFMFFFYREQVSLLAQRLASAPGAEPSQLPSGPPKVVFYYLSD